MHWSKFAVATGFICGLALWTFAQTSVRGTSQLRIPGPEVQNLMLGTWSLQAHAVSPESTLGDGTDTELWYVGSGGNSLIEELHARDSRGRPIDAFGPAWEDTQAQGQRYIWCANNLAEGCVISREAMRWEGDRFIYSEDERQGQKTVRHQEIFSDITKTSFKQTISQV